MKILEGKVISDKMTKAVTVSIENKYRHPLYGKILKSQKKVHASNEIGAQKGQLVKIAEIRPISKTISFKVIEILGQGKEVTTEKIKTSGRGKK